VNAFGAGSGTGGVRERSAEEEGLPVVGAVPKAADAADPWIASRVRAAEARAAPFAHWRMSEVLPESLARHFAALPYAPHPTLGLSGRREFHNAHRRYVAGPMLQSAPARALAEAFQSAPLVDAISTVAGARLSGTFLRIEYALDVDGFWLEPHTDLGVKRLTLFIQLGAPGQEGLGTDLYAGPRQWRERTPFAWNAGLLFVPSDDTWHGFEPRTIAGVRRSLIVNYVTDAWRERGQLAFPERPVGGA
jgi:hypothetical protein